MDTTDAPLKDVWDGWGWRNRPVGLERQYDEETKRYGDVPTEELRSLVQLPLGLSLSINIDGCVLNKLNYFIGVFLNIYIPSLQKGKLLGSGSVYSHQQPPAPRIPGKYDPCGGHAWT